MLDCVQIWQAALDDDGTGVAEFQRICKSVADIIISGTYRTPQLRPDGPESL